MAMTSNRRSVIMDRENELIELGVVSDDTRGFAIYLVDDEEGGFRNHTGLSND